MVDCQALTVIAMKMFLHWIQQARRLMLLFGDAVSLVLGQSARQQVSRRSISFAARTEILDAVS